MRKRYIDFLNYRLMLFPNWCWYWHFWKYQDSRRLRGTIAFGPYECKEGSHSKCPGWAEYNCEKDGLDLSYGVECICECHIDTSKEEPGLEIKTTKQGRLF